MSKFGTKIRRNKRKIAAVVAIIVAIIMLAGLIVPFFMPAMPMM